MNPARGSSTWSRRSDAGFRLNKPAWQIQIDGAARGNPGPAGIGAVLRPPGGRGEQEISLYLGETTNNVAEYCALVIALQAALQARAQRVAVFTDSELLARQVEGTYRVKDRQLQWLHVLVRHLLRGFDSFAITHIPREKNRRADRLANQSVNEGLKQRPISSRKKRVPLLPLDQPTLF